MFRDLGNLKYLTKEKELKISLNELKPGINFLKHLLFTKRVAV